MIKSLTIMFRIFLVGAFVLLINSGNVDNVVLFEDGAENYSSFSTEFEGWQNIDNDVIRCWGIKNLNFAGEFEKSSFIVMNNTEDQIFNAYSGEKFFACINADISNYGGTGNNDWLISPCVNIDRPSELVFYARAFNHDYGKELFNVAVNENGTEMKDFKIISGPGILTSNEDWTEYRFDLSKFEGENINFAINCVSKNAYMLWIDDIKVIAKSENYFEKSIPENYSLRQNFPNPFNPSTTIEFSIPEKNNVKVEIYNLVGELISTITNKIYEKGSHKLQFTANNLASGFYIYKMTSGKFTEAKKLTILK